MTVLEDMIRFRVRLVLVLIGLAIGLNGTAQSDTLLLSGVEISAPGPDREMAGVEVQRFILNEAVGDAATDIGSYLRSRTDLDLRTYGPGGSIGLSMRGSSTSQVQVSINGIPFEIPSLAMVDLSILPVAAFGKMSLYRGSAAAYLGNAAVGGGLMLDSRRGNGSPGVTQTFTAGSFGAFGSVTSLGVGDDQFSANTTVYLRSNKNDFLRPDPYDSSSKIKQENAGLNSRGWVQSFNFLTGRTRFSAFLWADQTDREIPGGRSRATSEATQADRNMRAQASSFTDLGRVQIESSIAYDRGVLNYADPTSNIDDHSGFSTAHFRLKAISKFGPAEVYVITDYRNAKAETATYDRMKHRSGPAVTGGVHALIFGSTTRASLVVRQEWLNDQALPPLPVLGVERQLGDAFSISASAGRTYRLPGLNDLYWNPGGNPDLKPESGWFQEASLRLNSDKSPRPFRASITGFHRLIDHWILWRPGPAYWSPVNIQSVRSYGIEGSTGVDRKINHATLTQELSATYVVSESIEAAFDGDQSVGRQLIYVPKLSAMSRTSILIRDRWKMELPVRYISRRYTTSDNTRSLDPYLLFDFEAEYRSRLMGPGYRFAIFGAVRNVLDRDYRLQDSHYMPGRYFEAGLRMLFQFNSQTP